MLGLFVRPHRGLAKQVGALLRRVSLPREVPGAVFLVRLQGGRRVVRVFGDATAHTVFQVMSISKPVTALGVLRLVQRGVLELDAPITRVLRSWRFQPDAAGGFSPDAIMVRQLLCHAAGLNIHGYGWVEPGRPRPTAAEVLSSQERRLRIVSEPGSIALYSGGGYMLLQQVVEDATGRPFAAVMRDEVFRPLKMRRSSFDEDRAVMPHLSARHDAAGAPMPPGLCAGTAATGLYSTASDLERFLAVFGGSSSFLQPELLALMKGAQATDARGRRWAAGFYLLEHPNETVLHHGGWKEGWWGQFDAFVRAGHRMVCLSNGDAAETHVKPVVAALRELLLNSAP